MSGLVAKTKLTFRVEPEEQGGATQTVSIDRNRLMIPVKRKHREKATKPDKFLLIGFDTEYQSIAAVDVTEVRVTDRFTRRTHSLRICTSVSLFCAAQQE